MDDAFLYRYRRRPRPAFAEALYQRISPPCAWIPMASLRQMGQSLALIGMVLLVTLAVSPEARARAWRQVSDWM